MTYKISVNVDGVGEEIEAQLLSSLRAHSAQSVNRNFTLSIERDLHVISGVTATTSYGWLLIKTLWVTEEARNCGIGTTLLHRAEQEAIISDCHGAWLDTSSPGARNFYLAKGYSEFGALANRPTQFPPQHRRWFMQKLLQ